MRALAEKSPIISGVAMIQASRVAEPEYVRWTIADAVKEPDWLRRMRAEAVRMLLGVVLTIAEAVKLPVRRSCR
jgi:hypothetical protein